MSRSRRIPKYRHYRPKNLGVVRIDGRDHYLGQYGSTESLEAYHKKIAEWLASGSTATFKLSDPKLSLTVEQLILAYWQFAKTWYVKNGKPTSEIHNVRRALRHLRKLYGQSQAAEFGPLALQAVREDMIRTGNCRNVINTDVSRIRQMFKWGVARELLPSSLYEALRTVTGLRKGRTTARESDPVLPVSDSDLGATLPDLPEVVRSMARFQRLTGCRPEEVRFVRPRNVDTSSDVWVYRPDSHKTEHHGRDRLIFMVLAAGVSTLIAQPFEDTNCRMTLLPRRLLVRFKNLVQCLKKWLNRRPRTSYCLAITRWFNMLQDLRQSIPVKVILTTGPTFTEFSTENSTTYLYP